MSAAGAGLNQEVSDRARRATVAFRRCNGVWFFSFFGGCWLLLSAFAFGVFKPLEVAAIVLVSGLLLWTAIRIQARAKKEAVEALPNEDRKRDGRVFGIINAGQWIAVFLVFMVFPRIGHADLTFPAFVFIIGMHFFLMPPSYRYQSSYVIGGLMVVWSILCPILFKGDAVVAFVTLGAGIALVLGAAWALRFAAKQLEGTEL